MFDELDKYKSNGHFFFTAEKKLSDVCNAPKNGMGVYVVYALKGGRIELVYIGSSGWVTQEGEPKSRRGGIFDRLVNGNQFGGHRKKTWKQKIIAENIEALDIYWYETFDKDNADIPAVVEGIIIQRYFNIHGTLPRWNKQY